LVEKEEHLVLLGGWHYSGGSDGDWIGFHGWDEVPYRKLVRAISRQKTQVGDLRHLGM
jgi:hypothetical protein